MTERSSMSAAQSHFDELLHRIRVRPDEEVDAIRRDDRANDALKIADRLPAWLRRWHQDRLDACDGAMVKRAASWSPRQSMLLMGPTGVGKSTVAAWCFHRVLRSGILSGGEAWERAKGLRWLDAVNLERARSEHPLGKGEAPEIIAAKMASVLFLDDAGQDRNTKAVEDVVASRYVSGLVTVVTTNLSPEGMTDHYGAVTVRKLREARGGKAIVIERFE